MTPAELHETVTEGWRERVAICIAEGEPEELARDTANRDRVKFEARALLAMEYPSRRDYLEMVAKSRGRLEMRMLRILLMNA
jgi:hypothetical protein